MLKKQLVHTVDAHRVYFVGLGFRITGITIVGVRLQPLKVEMSNENFHHEASIHAEADHFMLKLV